MKFTLRPDDALEAFVVANLAFLGADIVVAHAANGFARVEEWIPIAFSALATVAMIPGLFSRRLRARLRVLALAAGAGAILVGVSGMLWHLGSSFFARQTLRDLVYAAPFVAPLSYTGVGLLLVLSRMEEAASDEWCSWVMFLAAGGFAGNFVLSLLDHAQNGFFRVSEWLPVAAAAVGASFLLFASQRPRDARFGEVCLAVLAGEIITGVLGFVLHAAADLQRPGETVFQKALHGAPAFAPLLFANLALLAAIGILAARQPRAVV